MGDILIEYKFSFLQGIQVFYEQQMGTIWF